MATRTVVLSGLLAATYVILTWLVAPLAYGPIQLRISEVLKPAALFHPAFALAFGVGNGMANLMSPFGIWDFGVMPLVDCSAALLCWWLRRLPFVGIGVQAVVISAGVAAFPLGIAAGLPFMPTFVSVLASECILLVVGYQMIWKRYGAYLLRGRQ